MRLKRINYAHLGIARVLRGARLCLSHFGKFYLDLVHLGTGFGSLIYFIFMSNFHRKTRYSISTLLQFLRRVCFSFISTSLLLGSELITMFHLFCFNTCKHFHVHFYSWQIHYRFTSRSPSWILLLGS